MLHRRGSHTPRCPRARTKTEHSKANKKDFSVSLAIALMAETPTSRSEGGRDGAWMRFSDTRYLLGLPHWEAHGVPDPPALVWAVSSSSGTRAHQLNLFFGSGFQNIFPTSLPLIIIADMFAYHGGLRTSCPGTNHTKGKFFPGDCGLW